MDRQKGFSILAFAAWLILMLLLWLNSWASGNLHSFSTYLVAIYLIAMPVGAVRFIEKQSIIERFGIQAFKFLLLMLLIFTSLWVTYLSGVVDWTAFVSLVLAPIPEEIFFRGYILGRVTNGKTKLTLRRALFAHLLASLIFALSHVFKYDLAGISFSFGFGLIMGFTYLMTGSILLPSIVHTGFNFLIIVSLVSESSILVFSLFLLIGFLALGLSVWGFLVKGERGILAQKSS